MSDLNTGRHEPVLLREAIEALSVRPDGIYVDATFGRGGHAKAILSRLGPKGTLYALDRDPEAVQVAGLCLGDEGRFQIERGSFGALARFCEGWGITGQVDGLLLDIGVSSPQLDDPARGFSFMEDGPLDMRMDPDDGPSAAEWLRQADEREIAQVLWRYGEERYARRIARAIVAARSESPLETTGDLASLVQGVVPSRERAKHPATRTFQALRIRINRELEALKAGLEQSLDVLRAGGRLVVICFHSLEDRLVKRFIRANARVPQAPRRLPVNVSGARPKLRAVGKLIRPSEVECHANPRARSALMRVAQVLA